MSAARRLAALQARNRRCARCLDAGYPVVPPPVVASQPPRRAYLLGLAPGQVESETGLPWQGRAGRQLRRWLRLDEERFFATFYCAAVTRCYPGKAASGRGDRTATAAERELCSSWTEAERELLEPELVVTVGLTATRRLVDARTLTDAVGKSYLVDAAIVVPLPHPSGASGWLNEASNRARLGKALTHVRRELARLEPVP